MTNDDDPDDEIDTGPVVTPGGRTLHESDFEALADEAERGYDVSHLVRRERQHEMQRAITRAIRTDDKGMAELELEMGLVSIFHKAKHRRFLNWCAMRFWAVSEKGPFGTLGNWCDDLELMSRRTRASHNLAKKQ